MSRSHIHLLEGPGVLWQADGIPGLVLAVIIRIVFCPQPRNHRLCIGLCAPLKGGGNRGNVIIGILPAGSLAGLLRSSLFSLLAGLLCLFHAEVLAECRILIKGLL